MPGTFTYTPAAGTVLPAGAAQTLSVTFTPTDAANYTTATANVAITVLKATPAITWPAPAAIIYGTVLGADAVECVDAGARHVRVHASGGHVALGAGAAQSLSVTFTPSDAANYTTATASTTLTVLKVDARRSPGRPRPPSPTARRSARLS